MAKSSKNDAKGKRGASGVIVGKTDIGGREGVDAVTPDGKPIKIGGGEIIMSEKAAEDNCEELSKMNQEAGGVAFDCDLQKIANTDRASGNMPNNEYYRKSAEGGSKLPSTGENIQFTPLHIKMLIPEVTVVEYTRNGKRELGVVREVKEIQSMSIFQKRDSYYVVHVYRNVTGTPRVTDIISANRITGIVTDPGTIWNTYGQFGRYRFFVATKEVSKQANEMKSWGELSEDTKERFTRWYAGEVFGNQGGAMAAGGQIKQGDIDYYNSKFKILVGGKTNLIPDIKERYKYEPGVAHDGIETIKFYDNGYHFGTLFKEGRFSVLKHDGTLNEYGWRKSSTIGGAMAAGGQIKQGDIVDFYDVKSKVVSIFADNGTAKIIIPFESSKEGVNIADDWDYDIVNLSELKPIKMAEAGTKIPAETQYKEAQRYIDNARADLKKAGLTTDGKYYYDTKYVKSAAGTAYAGAELALKWFLELRGFEAKMSDASEIKRHLSMINKKMLKTFNTVYETLHKNIYYGSDTRKTVVDGTIDAAEELIAYLRPYKQPAVYEAGAKTNTMEKYYRGQKFWDEVGNEYNYYSFDTNLQTHFLNDLKNNGILVTFSNPDTQLFSYNPKETKIGDWKSIPSNVPIPDGWREQAVTGLPSGWKIIKKTIAEHGAKTNPMENEYEIERINDRLREIKAKLQDIDKEFKRSRTEGASRNAYLRQRELWHEEESLKDRKGQLRSKEEIHNISPSGERAASGTKTNPMETQKEIEKLKQKMIDLGYTAAYGMLEKYEKESDEELLRVKDVLESNTYWNLDKSERLSAIRTILKIRGVIKEDAASGAKTPLPDKLTLYPMPDFHYLKIGNLIKDTQGNQSKIVRHTDTGIVLKKYEDIPYDFPEVEMTFEDFCEKMDAGFVIPGCPYDTDIESDRCLLRKEISLIKMGNEVNAKESRIKRLEEEGETDRAALRAEAERQREEGETEMAALRAEAERQRAAADTEKSRLTAEADTEANRLRSEYEDTIEGLNVLKELNLPPDVKKLKEEYEDTIEGLKVLNQTNGREMQGGGHMDGRASGQPYSTVRINTKEQGIIFKEYGRLVSKQKVLEDVRAEGLTVLDLRILDHKGGFIVQRSGLQGGGKAGSPFKKDAEVIAKDIIDNLGKEYKHISDATIFRVAKTHKIKLTSEIIEDVKSILEIEGKSVEQYAKGVKAPKGGSEFDAYDKRVTEEDIEEKIDRYEGQGHGKEEAVAMAVASIGDVGEDVLAGGGKVKKITKKDKYYHARFKSPKGATTCRVPEWTKPIVRDIYKDAKVTTCKYKDNGSEKWAVQKVMIPVGNGMTKAKAKSIAEQIGDKLLTSKN